MFGHFTALCMKGLTVNTIARSSNIDEDKFDPMFLSPTMFKVPVNLFKTGIKSNVTICFSLPNLTLPKPI